MLSSSCRVASGARPSTWPASTHRLHALNQVRANSSVPGANDKTTLRGRTAAEQARLNAEAKQVKTEVKQGAQELKSEVKAGAADAKDVVQAAAQDAENAVKDGASKAEDVAQDAGEAAKKHAKVLSHRINETFATDELMEELNDKEARGKRGELVLIAQLITLALVAFPPAQLAGLVYLAGMLSMVAGLVSFSYSLLSLGRNFSPLVAPRKSHSLVTSGMYSYMRHPFDAGLLLLAAGWAAVSLSESRMLLTLALGVLLDYKARKEEQALVERYGSEYEAYMKTVNRFVPNLA